MNPIDQTQLSMLKQRADDIVALAAKAAVHAHLAHHHALDDAAVLRGDVEKAVKTYGSRLAQLRAVVTGQFETVMGFVGGPAAPPEAVPVAPATGEAPPAPPVAASSRTLAPIQKLAAAVELLGELTNAQVQKFMRCDADKAREIIANLVKQGLLEKVSPKVYKSTARQEAVS